MSVLHKNTHLEKSDKLSKFFAVKFDQYGCNKELLDAAPSHVNHVKIPTIQQMPHRFTNPLGKKAIVQPAWDEKDHPLVWIKMRVHQSWPIINAQFLSLFRVSPSVQVETCFPATLWFTVELIQNWLPFV